MKFARRVLEALLLLLASATVAAAAERPTDWANQVLQLLEQDAGFSWYVHEVRFSAPAYAFVQEVAPHPGHRLFRAVRFESVTRPEDAGGLRSRSEGVAIVEDGKVVIVAPAKFTVEWAVAEPALEARVYYSTLDPKRDTQTYAKLLPSTDLLLARPAP
jgi:hypothetical protein